MPVKQEVQQLPLFMQKRIKVTKFFKQTPREEQKKSSILN